MTKQEKIRKGIEEYTDYPAALWAYLHENGLVIKVDRELPYKWKEITREHSYHPHKKFTTYALTSKYGTMFGYVQQYQSLTGYKCFEDQKYFIIYLGNEERAHSDSSAPTLEEAKAVLLKKFLLSKDNPDNDIPAGYVAVGPLILEMPTTGGVSANPPEIVEPLIEAKDV